MKKFPLILIILLFFYPVLARDLKGVITSAGKGVGGVLVTDGVTIVKSDARGRYKLNTDDRTQFVYIVQPSGYQTPFRNGVCQFYNPVTSGNDQYNFELTKLSQDQDFVLLAIADVQTGNDKHFAKFQEESIPDLKKTIASYPAGTPIFGISLGDIVWDQFEHFARYKKEIESLGIPFYSVIGNHDHDKDSPKAQGEDRYKAEFGPTYYACCLGQHWCIVLDNIDYEGNKVYDNRISTEQLDWLKKLVKFIPSGSPVILGIHANLFGPDSTKGTENAQELLNILQDYKVDVFSGHTHINVNYEKGKVFEHNVATICGSWWMPVAGKDGTPKGYEVLEGRGKQLSWFYKSTGQDRDYQMKLYPRGSFSETPQSVVAHVWNYDTAWKVEWQEDGKSMGNMKRFKSTDPDYSKYTSTHKVGEYKQPIASETYFSATPSPSAREVTIIVTDRFGHTYRESLKL